MSPADVLAVVAVLLVGILAGNETGTLAVVHPALDRAPRGSGRPAAQAVIAGYGRVMPALMPVTIAVTVIAGWVVDGAARALLLVAAGALVLMLVITFARLMPLNKLQLAADDSTPEGDWNAWRSRWRRWHTVRVVCDVLALVLVASALVIR